MTEQEAFEEWAIANWPFAADEDAASIWHAALAWLRSQVVPVAWMYERDGMVHDGMYPPIFLQSQRPLCRDEDWTETPLYLAPRAIENDDREYLSAIAHLGRAMRRLVIAARTSGGTAGPDAELMAACAQAEDAMSVGAIGRAMEAPQPAIPDGYRLVPVEPTGGMLEAAIAAGWSRIDIYQAMIAAAPEPGEPA